MRNKVAVGTALGLITMLITWGTARSQEAETGRFVEHLVKHPVTQPHGTYRFRLFLMDIAKGKATPIVDEPGQGLTHCGSPWWSKDGKRILFDATPMTMWSLSRLMAIELGDGPPKLADLGMGNCPSSSPDGERIAFLSNEEGPETGIYVMKADGSDRTRLGSYGRPKWSPDGRQILISSFSNPCQVSLMDVETTETKSLRLPDHQFFRIPYWADAGTIVASIGIGTVAADTVALLDVTDPDAVKIKSVLWKKGSGPEVTPADAVYHADTRRCVFVGRQPKGMALYTVTVGDPAPPRRLEDEGFDHYMGDLALSPDGRFLLFLSDRKDLLPRGATASVALAQGEPATSTRLHSNVRDAAELFSPEAIKKAESALERIERDTLVATVIETAETLDGDKIEEAALGRARRSGARGIYILIAKSESKIQVLTSKEFTGLLSEPQRVAIRLAFVEDFKQRDFNAGLERAVEEIGNVLAKAKADGKFAGLAEGPVRGEGQASATPLVVRDQVRLNLAGARRIIAGAEAKASALGVKVNIAVVDDGGHMLTFARMDGARPASGYTATTKAVTAATFRQATGPIPPGTSSPDVLLNLSLQNAAAASGGKLTTLYGGIPVVVDGQTIGAVGVGGGTGEQDAVVAQGGVDALLAELQPKPRAEQARTSETKAESTTGEIKVETPAREGRPR